MSTLQVAGLRFRNAGKIQYYSTGGMRLEAGEHVVVETARGPEIARVVIAPDQVVVNELGDDLKPILRLATDEDIRRADGWKKRADELLPEARRLSEEVGFPVRIDSAEYTLDGRRLTFAFTSEERLDYREFLRKASERFSARVDMRQLGARDRAKVAGGYGICGLELCCSSWLTSFPSISIRMAKEQELPLNPQKISGLCGRLLCCLSYEEDGYREMRRSLPKIGQRVSTPTGEARVISLNILRRSVTLVMPDGSRVEVTDRDLGTVVRWDTTSKSGDPPPSISRADAIAQGLIQPDERDLAGEDEPEPEQPQGRGRLPAPRRLPQPRPAADPTATPAPPRGRGQPQQGRGGQRAPREEQPAAREGTSERGRRQRGAPGRDAGQPAPQRREAPPPRERSTPAPPAGATRVFRRAGQPTGGDAPADGTQERSPRPERAPLPQRPSSEGRPPRTPPPPAAEKPEATGDEAARRKRRRGTRGGRNGRGEGGDTPSAAE